jgi:hypothetical protein
MLVSPLLKGGPYSSKMKLHLETEPIGTSPYITLYFFNCLENLKKAIYGYQYHIILKGNVRN